MSLIYSNKPVSIAVRGIDLEPVEFCYPSGDPKSAVITLRNNDETVGAPLVEQLMRDPRTDFALVKRANYDARDVQVVLTVRTGSAEDAFRDAVQAMVAYWDALLAELERALAQDPDDAPLPLFDGRRPVRAQA